MSLVRIETIGGGGWLIMKGEIRVGTLGVLLGYVGGLFGPVQGLNGVYPTNKKAQVSLDEIFGSFACRCISVTGRMPAMAFCGFRMPCRFVT